MIELILLYSPVFCVLSLVGHLIVLYYARRMYNETIDVISGLCDEMNTSTAELRDDVNDVAANVYGFNPPRGGVQ